VLGPFQGKPACVRIALGRGVCGTAAASRRTVVVPDVHAFPGHIACDSASESEIVVPVLRASACWASSTSTARDLRASTRRTRAAWSGGGRVRGRHRSAVTMEGANEKGI